jgi:lipopolysaccharide biosynthesis glycosyltransferase
MNNSKKKQPRFKYFEENKKYKNMLLHGDMKIISKKFNLNHSYVSQLFNGIAPISRDMIDFIDNLKKSREVLGI